MSPLSSYLLQTLLALLVIGGVGAVVIWGGRRLGLSRPAGPMRLVGQLPLDGRRAVYLVKVGPRVIVVGASEAGLSRLAELEADALDLPADVAPTRRFSDVLAQFAVARQPEEQVPEPPAAAASESEAP